MRLITNKVWYMVIPGLLLGIYIGMTSFLMCLLCILLLLFYTNRHTAGFYLLLYGGLLAGYTRATFPGIPIYGVMIEFVGLLLLSNGLEYIQRARRNIISLLLVFAVFFFFYLNASQYSSYANSKISNIVMHGSFAFIAYYVFDRSRNISIETLVQLLLVSTIGMISYTCARYGFSVGNILDFDWYRSQSVIWQQVNQDETMLADYQQVGMYAAFSVSLFLAQRDFSYLKAVFYAIVSIQLILTSGCRQALLAVIMVMFFRLFYFNTVRNFFQKILLIALSFFFIYVVYMLLASSEIEVLNKTLQSGDEGRYYIYISAWNLFLENLWLGVGLGGFPLYVDAPWPHNMVLEILCECGLIGFILLASICIVFVVCNKVSLKHSTVSEVYYFMFFIAMIVRVMVSADLMISIELLSALFAVSLTKYKLSPSTNLK